MVWSRMAPAISAFVALVLLVSGPASAEMHSRQADTDSLGVLDSLFRNGEVIDVPVSGLLEAAAAYRSGSIGEDRLHQTFDQALNNIFVDVEIHEKKVSDFANNPIVMEMAQKPDSLYMSMAITIVPSLLSGTLEKLRELEAESIKGNDSAVDLIEADLFDQKSGFYAARYTYIGFRGLKFEDDDLLEGIYLASKGMNEVGDMTFRILAESWRSRKFDSENYATVMNASLRLIKRGLAHIEGGLAGSSPPDGTAGLDSEVRPELQQRRNSAARQFVAGARAFNASIQEIIASTDAAGVRELELDDEAARASLRRLGLQIENAISETAALHATRHDLVQLESAGAVNLGEDPS